MTNELVLVGKGSERLKGNEGLQEIVEKFTTEIKKDILTEKTNTHIVSALKKISKRIPLDTERDYYNRIIDSLVCEYLSASFQIDNPEIDPLLFSLQRTIQHPVSNRQNANFNLPLLARVKFGKNNKWEHKTNSQDNYYSATFLSEAPPAPLSVKEKIRELHRIYYKSIVEGLENEVLNDGLQRDLLAEKANLSFWQYWIPKNSELKIEVERIDKDPFVIAQLYNKHFLVSQWDVKTEEPYEHYLGEFKK